MSNSNSEPSHDSHQLAWQAFQYVAGQMNERETQSFEQVLDERQAAREMVAKVVELTEVVYWVERRREPVVVSPSLRRRLEPAGWMSLGAAACLFFVLGMGYFSAETSQPLAEQEASQKVTEPTKPIPNDLALAAVRLPDMSFALPQHEWENERGFADAEIEPLLDQDLEEDVAIPAWMVSAVSTQTSQENLPAVREN